MIWFKKHPYPEFWNNYRALFKEKQQTNIDNIRFVVFDTETTGLDITKDRILSIGCVAVKGTAVKIADQLECYVKQDVFNSETVAIHGLLKSGTHTKLEEINALEKFLNYIKNAVLVAHHTAFDVAMINQALKRHGLPKLKNVVLDTGQLYKKTLKKDVNKSHYSLDELSKIFHIPQHDRHTASGDAYITALLFLKLIAKLKQVTPNYTLTYLKAPKKRIGLL
jgi:DNA polymerase-3 subunit epsilon